MRGQRFAHLDEAELRQALVEQPRQGNLGGVQQPLEGSPQATIDEPALPQRVELGLTDALVGKEAEGLEACGGLLGIGEPHTAEELLVDVDRGVRVVEAVLIAVCDKAPAHAADGGIAERLGGALAVVERDVEGLGLD